MSSQHAPHTPTRPPGWPYESLCRYALATEIKTNPQFIHSGSLPGSSTAPGQRVPHQIDLFWKTENALCQILNIANAKHLHKSKVDLRDLMTLLGVMQQVHAQKGMLITNTGFTQNAFKVAEDHGIALVVIKPLVPLDNLPPGTVAEVAQELESRAAAQQSPVYDLKVILKSWAPDFHSEIGNRQSELANPPAPPPPPPAIANRQSQIANPPDSSPDPSCLRASVPSCLPEEDLSYLIAAPAPDFPDSIDNRSMPESVTSNKMIQNSPAPQPPPARPFGIRTK